MTTVSYAIDYDFSNLKITNNSCVPVFNEDGEKLGTIGLITHVLQTTSEYKYKGEVEFSTEVYNATENCSKLFPVAKTSKKKNEIFIEKFILK